MSSDLESWQSGNATDSKSVEPANTGAQVQILYSPYLNNVFGNFKFVLEIPFFLPKINQIRHHPKKYIILNNNHFI